MRFMTFGRKRNIDLVLSVIFVATSKSPINIIFTSLKSLALNTTFHNIIKIISSTHFFEIPSRFQNSSFWVVFGIILNYKIIPVKIALILNSIFLTAQIWWHLIISSIKMWRLFLLGNWKKYTWMIIMIAAMNQ